MLFFGHVVSEKGISPDSKKVEALQNVAPPPNAAEVRNHLSSAESNGQWTQEEQIFFRTPESSIVDQDHFGIQSELSLIATTLVSDHLCETPFELRRKLCYEKLP